MTSFSCLTGHVDQGRATLVAHDRSEKVIDLRSEFQGAMSEDLTSDIERLTGRKVIAFMSANHIDPDLGAELFILEALPVAAIDGSMSNASPAAAA